MLRENLRRLREQRGWTQEDLAARSGVPQGTISNIEAGRTQSPRLGSVEALATALGVTVEEVTGEVTRWPLDQAMQDEFRELIAGLRPESQHMLLALARQLLLLQRGQA